MTRLYAALRRFGPAALIVIAVIAVLASGFMGRLNLEELRERRELLEALVRAHPLISLGAYVGVYTLVVALSLPAALVMSLTGGLLFGPWIGGGAATFSCTLGSVIIFLVCRTALGDLIQRRAGATAARIEAEVRRDAFAYVVMLRLIPVMPFWLANLALSLIDIRLPTFALASFVGIAPVSVVIAGLGSGLNRMFDRGVRPDLNVMLRPEILLPLMGLAALSLAPILLRRWRGRS